MSNIAPFQPMGNSVILTTNAGASTSQSTPVTLAGSGNLNIANPQMFQVRLINIGTATIWMSFTQPASATVAIPSAGTTTVGTPQPVLWLFPNVEMIFTLACGIGPLTGVSGTPNGFWVNTISTGVSQSFYMQLGEGA